MPADAPPLVVALIDTRWVGHHPTFFREFAASLRRLGHRVIALCPEPAELPGDDGVFAAEFSGLHGSLWSAFDNDPATTLYRWWAARRALDLAEDRSGWSTDVVFFPYLDNFLRFLPSPTAPDLILGRPWSGLYFRNQHLGRPARTPQAWVRRLAKGDRLLKSGRALPFIGVLDERFNADLKRHTGRDALPFPDITDETPPAADSTLSHTLRNMARGRPIIGLAGSLEKRKGLLTLLRAAEASAAAGDDWFFAAVGPMADGTFSSEELAWIDSLRERLAGSLFVDMSRQRIPDGAPYNSVFSTFALSWAAYEDFQGSSNTLTKAALFEVPVVATAGECIGARVDAFALGATFPEGDASAARAAIARVLAEERTGVRRGYEAYRQFHSRPSLDATFSRLLGTLNPSRTQAAAS